MDKKIQFQIPIKTVSEANCSEHWTKKSKRHKQQQFFIRLAMQKYAEEITLPCEISMTRLSPGALDDDNLRTSLKWIRDEISECIFPEMRSEYMNTRGKIIAIKGRADADDRIKWQYSQEKNSRYGLKVEICF